KVIDCKTRAIVKAPPNCKYAALSYVWGTPEAGTVDQSIGNAQGIFATDVCPAVIRDSLLATLSLDLQYLWVDRYCIDQADAKEKHDQISQMDLIYAIAYVTIIAATRNPDDGLPGAAGSNSNRKQQPRVNIRGQIIASTLPNPQMSLEESRWVTRGWTYQEGILSKRRLIFTDNQVAFECGGMHYAESLILPLDAMHHKRENNKVFRKHIPDGALILKSPGKDAFDIMSYIREFSKRELSFPGDRINAMKGVFHAFETGPQPVYQIMGIPILELSNLMWSKTPTGGFLLGLTWSHVAPGIRTALLPSWTWAGWSG
ncbi:HET-domain-containing protein, partial [Hyaloscypha variabilis F]